MDDLRKQKHPPPPEVASSDMAELMGENTGEFVRGKLPAPVARKENRWTPQSAKSRAAQFVRLANRPAPFGTPALLQRLVDFIKVENPGSPHEAPCPRGP